VLSENGRGSSSMVTTRDRPLMCGVMRSRIVGWRPAGVRGFDRMPLKPLVRVPGDE